MKQLREDEIKFFVLCGPQHDRKKVYVVLYVAATTLWVKCLTTQQTFFVEFKNIWEMILDTPALPVVFRNRITIQYATATRLQGEAVSRAAQDANIDISIDNVTAALVPYLRPNTGKPMINDEIVDHRIRRTNVMRERRQLEGILAALVLPQKYVTPVLTTSCTTKLSNFHCLRHIRPNSIPLFSYSKTITQTRLGRTSGVYTAPRCAGK
jgi:hypothetical protein